MSDTSGRRVVANLGLTLDGRYHGPAGPQDMSIVMPYALTDAARNLMTNVSRSATTALLGRVNAEGFLGYWPQVADDESADPRDRGYATWLRDTEKVVLSSTLIKAPWKNARVVNAPTAEVVDRLKAQAGGDILVNSSVSVIKALLAADKLDRLALTIYPVVVGTGPRLFDDGLPASKWTLAESEAGEFGTLCLYYDREH